MNANSKEQLKTNLQKSGLLKFVLFVNRTFRLHKIFEFMTGLKWYLFNNCITHFPVHFIRIFFLRNMLGLKVGRSCFIHMGSRFSGNISIGNNVIIGRNCVFLGEIIIKNNVSITAETYVFATSHLIDSPTFETVYKPVIIEDHVWIGARAMVLPGVTIGRGAVLGAASVATKDLLPFSVCVGSPAKEVRKRSEAINYTLSYSPYFE